MASTPDPLLGMPLYHLLIGGEGHAESIRSTTRILYKRGALQVIRRILWRAAPFPSSRVWGIFILLDFSRAT